MDQVPRIMGDLVAKYDERTEFLLTIRDMPKESIVLDGVEILCAYSTYGKFYPQTQQDPAEYPELLVESINFSGSWLSPQDTRAWLDRLPDAQELLEEAVFGG